MRTILTTIQLTCVIVFFPALSGKAQCPTLTQCCLPNGDFAQSSCTGESAFLGSNLPPTPNNCVTSWTATHGSPGLYSISHTSNYALLGSGNYAYGFASEGIRANFNFTANTTYQITFKMRCYDPFNLNAIHNPGILSVRAMNNGPSAVYNTFVGYLDHTMPPLPASNELITTVTTNVLPYVGQNWESVTVNFTPTTNYTQVWFYLNSLNTQQSIITLDDITIKQAAPTAVFHLQSSSGTNAAPQTQFTTCEKIYLNGLASQNDQNHYIDVWRRPIGTQVPFVWVGNYGANGWTASPAGVVDITNAMDVSFLPNYEYRIKLATQNACVGWVESYRDITVISNTPNPVVHIESNVQGTPVTSIQSCQSIYLVETYESSHGNNYDHYYLDLWMRDYNLGGSFQWIANSGSNGWTTGVLPQRLDIKSIFSNQGISFIPGKEYQVKLALSNTCNPWVETTTNFNITNCIQGIQLSSGESIESSEDKTIEKLSVFPNPVSNTMNVSMRDYAKLEILNSVGQILLTTIRNSSAVDVSGLKEGVYFVRITKPDGTVIETQFIKK